MKYIVYKTTNLVNEKFYVGVHHDTGGDYYLYLGSGTVLKKAILKYGRANFKRETLFEFDDRVDAFKKEAELIETFLGPNCYNIASGGCGGYVGVEAYLKVSKAMKGRKFSKESIQKKSIASSGIRNAMYGKPSPIRRKVLAMELSTGVEVSFKSRQDAANYTKVMPSNISSVCFGHRKCSKGWTFTYYEITG